MIGPGGLGTSGGPAFASADTPLTSALGTLDPAYKLAQILTGSGDTDSGDLTRPRRRRGHREEHVQRRQHP